MQNELTPISIPYQSRTLDNGLQVIINEDRSAPIAAVHIMYRAGSGDEIPGRTGLAHLLEHLLFEGSANCPKGEFDRLLEEVGGSNNGSTWLDRTNYYEVVPSHAVELALWLERERMGYFLPVLDEEMLEVQRSVVINERKQSYENRPYGLAHEKLHELLFPEGHPYAWPTIGYTRDLEAMTLEDARSFFMHFYAPSNAVLVLAGDVDTERGFELAERYFGDLPTGPVPPVPNPAPRPASIQQRAAVLRDRVTFERVYLAWEVPGYATDDWIALDVLNYVLADGESSRLTSVLLREKQIAQQVDAYLYPTRLAGIFGVIATARTGHDADELADSIQDVIQGVLANLSEREVEGAIRRARRDHLNAIGNLEGRAEELAYSATVLGDAGRVEKMLNSYGSVTPDRIRDVVERCLAPEQAARVTVVPLMEAENAA